MKKQNHEHRRRLEERMSVLVQSTILDEQSVLRSYVRALERERDALRGRVQVLETALSVAGKAGAK
jgi:phage-related baseplate assembly protein